MIYFTADTHFYHKNIIKYCNRPFKHTHEMNTVMIERWNAVVTPRDTIYHLGDFAWRDVFDIMTRLNGKIYLCIGSHEKAAFKVRDKFEDVRESYWLKEHQIFMAHHMHYVWPKSHHGSYHLFGHSHGGLNAFAKVHGRCLDVGVDSHNFYPWSLNEVLYVMNPNNKEVHNDKEAHNGQD